MLSDNNSYCSLVLKYCGLISSLKRVVLLIIEHVIQPPALACWALRPEFDIIMFRILIRIWTDQMSSFNFNGERS